MKHQNLIDQLTLEEKAALLGGKGEWDSRDIPRLNIPSMIMSDEASGGSRRSPRSQRFPSGDMFSDGSYNGRQLGQGSGHRGRCRAG